MYKEHQPLIDEAYENYCKEYSSLYYLQDKIEYGSSDYHHDIEDYSFEAYTQEEFINKCQTDSEFSEKWGLTIEERELSLEERVDIFNTKMKNQGLRTQIAIVGVDENYWKSSLEKTEHNIPTRLITVTYQNKTITSYE